MKRLVITIFSMFAVFSVMFVIADRMGYADGKQFEAWANELQHSTKGRVIVAVAVIGLLLVDIVLPVPSSVVMAVSGRLLGFALGGTVSFIGAMAAAWLGYYACYFGGRRAFQRMIGEADTEKVKAWFEKYGVYAIVLSRSVPMLTEVLSCLAGLTRVSQRTFAIAAILGTLPVCFVYSYFGSADMLLAATVAVVIPAMGWIVVRLIKRDGAENAGE